MDRARKRLTGLLASAGIGVDGRNPWDIRVENEAFYARVLRHGSLGLGESYMDGWWNSERLDQFFARLLSAGLYNKAARSPGALLDLALDLLLNRQTRRLATVVRDHHYELGDDLFMSFLDSRNQYSCGYFAEGDDLEAAQERKLDLICRKLDLKPGDRLLDIGCGWGGLAAYAAEKHGCRVTGVNISGRQLDRARGERRDKGSACFLQLDYRDMEGTFDKIVSVGMFEHVGHKNHRRFMECVSRHMERNGLFLLHTIGSNTSTRSCDPWMRKYIFPNGLLPSLAQIGRAAEGLFVIEDVHNLGPHYDRTLMAWNERFQAAWPGLGARFPERFKRMWEYYLLSCAGAFRCRSQQLWQIVMTKPGRPQPDCRPSPSASSRQPGPPSGPWPARWPGPS